ncbi:MAG: crossover junction endodeoxyribonuclease RuvC [Desulfobacterales bacterium]|nr:crossover junction endodeoxyribonuclease RuvC [Desulfobacterales bacterium]MBS3756628.1 crossover junction endodeoxyribonuclease RuvC [Desulfobacterales bacterium]
MATFIGIDPGLAATGIAVIEGAGLAVHHYSYGTIQTDAGQDLPQRLDRIFADLSEILGRVRPDAMMVEDVFSLPRYPKSGITLGQVTGVILLAGYQAQIPVQQVAVREVKQVLTGNGNAGKQQLEASVRRRLDHSEPIKPSHASDALAMALVGLYRENSPASAFLRT